MVKQKSNLVGLFVPLCHDQALAPLNHVVLLYTMLCLATKWTNKKIETTDELGEFKSKTKIT